MAEITAYLVADTADLEDAAGGSPLSVRTRALVIAGMAVAAWGVVLLPVFLIFHH